MVTNLDVLLQARTDMKAYRESLATTTDEKTREVIIECIALTQTVINQTEDKIREGKA